MFSFGYFPGVWGSKADVSEPSIGSIFLGILNILHLPMKMEPIEGSETSAFKPQTPGKYQKENKLHKEHGESLKSRPHQSYSTQYITYIYNPLFLSFPLNLKYALFLFGFPNVTFNLNRKLTKFSIL